MPAAGTHGIAVAMAPPIRLRIRLMVAPGIAIGPGKADLLAALADTGSISAAARAMGMSYKKAWYLIDEMNRVLRDPVVHTEKGGRGRGGATLTPMGEQVLALYRAIEARAGDAAADDITAMAGLLQDG